MKKLALTLLLTTLSTSTFAEGIIVTERHMKSASERGLISCRTEIKKRYVRSDRFVFNQRAFSDGTEGRERVYYLNAKVDDDQAGKRVAVGFACSTGYRGEDVVSIEQVDGRYVKSGEDSVLLVSR